MKTDVWLKIGAKKKYGRWAAGEVSVKKTKPTCGGNQIAMKLTLEIPDDIFEEPIYEAAILIPSAGKKVPDRIEVEDTIKKAFAKKGIAINVSFEGPRAKGFTDELAEL